MSKKYELRLRLRLRLRLLKEGPADGIHVEHSEQRWQRRTLSRTDSLWRQYIHSAAASSGTMYINIRVEYRTDLTDETEAANDEGGCYSSVTPWCQCQPLVEPVEDGFSGACPVEPRRSIFDAVLHGVRSTETGRRRLSATTVDRWMDDLLLVHQSVMA